MSALTLDKTTDKQQMSFKREFFKNCESFCISGQEPSADIRAKRAEVKILAKGLLEKAEKEKREMSPTEIDAFDVCSSLLEDYQLALDNNDAKAEATAALQNQYNGGFHVNSAVEHWQDVQTGKMIPVLAKDNRLQDFVTPPAANAITSRDFFSSIAGQAKTGEFRAQMSENFDTASGYMVPEYIAAEIIDLMRSKNTVVQAGARTIPLPAAVTRVCKITADPSASWVTENTLIPTDSSMSIGAVEFHAHKLTCLIKASRELLQDASNAGTTIMNSIATAMALELDRAALFGTGVNMPLGLFTTADVCSYTYAANGNVLIGYDDMLYGVREIVTANGPIPSAAIMAPRTLVGYSLLKDGDGLPLIKPDLIKNLQFFDTTKVPVNQTQGTSTNCTSIILGTYSELVIGVRTGLQIQILNERFADTGQVGFLATMRADTAVYQPKAFCKVTGIRP